MIRGLLRLTAASATRAASEFASLFGFQPAVVVTDQNTFERDKSIPHSIQCICSLNSLSHSWGSLHYDDDLFLIDRRGNRSAGVR